RVLARARPAHYHNSDWLFSFHTHKYTSFKIILGWGFPEDKLLHNKKKASGGLFLRPDLA
ncbi:MAG: hypothetical protein WD850_00125, partial [Candidatus Spechtbacterales bacterium]